MHLESNDPHTAESTTLREGLRNRLAAVRGFFFAEEIPYGLASVRIALPCVLLLDLVERWPFIRELYSRDGAPAPLWVGYGVPSPFPELPGSLAVALFTLLIASLAAVSLGWMTRAALAVSTVLFFYFNCLDSIGTISKYTVIAGHALLLLTLSDCGAVLSLDARRRRAAGETSPRTSAVWPRRLLQILIGVVYFGAAMTKIRTPAFFSGDQMMFWMLTHVNEAHPVGDAMSAHPALLVVGAYAAILWEILFVFLAWRGVGRPLMLALGVGFHAATYFTLGLIHFPLMYFAVYFSFVNGRDAAVWGPRFCRLAAGAAARLGLPTAMPSWLPAATRLGPTAFVLTLWGVAVAGVAAERALDPYRERGPGGPLALRTLPLDEARAMLAAPERLRLEDQFFSLELGTHLFADTLVGRKSAFTRGETLLAQVIAPPPHEDLYVECNLHRADGRRMEHSGRVLRRETTRETFRYNVCDALPPGDYAIVLTAAGQEVARRPFTVAGSDTVESATVATPRLTPAAALPSGIATR